MSLPIPAFHSVPPVAQARDLRLQRLDLSTQVWLRFPSARLLFTLRLDLRRRRPIPLSLLAVVGQVLPQCLAHPPAHAALIMSLGRDALVDAQPLARLDNDPVVDQPVQRLQQLVLAQTNAAALRSTRFSRDGTCTLPCVVTPHRRSPVDRPVRAANHGGVTRPQFLPQLPLQAWCPAPQADGRDSRQHVQDLGPGELPAHVRQLAPAR